MKKVIAVIAVAMLFASCQLKGHFPDGTKMSFEHEWPSYFKLKKGDTIDMALWKNLQTGDKNWEANFGAHHAGDTVIEYGNMSKVEDIKIFILE